MDPMNTETLINQINTIKQAAISLGFDYPTDPNLQSATVSQLQEFLEELQEFITEESTTY